MQVIRIKNTSERALALARCLIGSPTVSILNSKIGFLSGVESKNKIYPFIFYDEWTRYIGFSEIIIPIETLKFDQFAAMREGDIPIIVKSPLKDYTQTANNVFIAQYGPYILAGNGMKQRKITITLDLEAAAKLEGVSVEEI